MSNYKVEVKTGDRKYAGTDAAVFIQLIGARGKSGEVQMDNAEDNYEQKHLDTFFLDLDEVGWINAIRMLHDNTGKHQGWYLDWVKVTNQSVGLSFKADFYRWLATNKDDHQIDVTKPVPIGPVELAQGTMACTFLGYDAIRKNNATSDPISITDTFTNMFKSGMSLNKATARTLSAGVKVGAEFVVKSEFTAGVTSTITEELHTYEEQVVQTTSEVQFELQPNQAKTAIELYYQNILTAQACANGLAMEFQVRFSVVPDQAFYDGWLSDADVQAKVHELLGQTIASAGGSPMSLPAYIPKTDAFIPVTAKPVAGALNRQNVKKVTQALDKLKAKPGPHNLHPVKHHVGVP